MERIAPDVITKKYGNDSHTLTRTRPTFVQYGFWNQAGELPKIDSSRSATNPRSGLSMLRQINTEISTGMGHGTIRSARMIDFPRRSSKRSVTAIPTVKLRNTDRKANMKFQTMMRVRGSKQPRLPKNSPKCRSPMNSMYPGASLAPVSEVNVPSRG